jgi:pectate lyase
VISARDGIEDVFLYIEGCENVEIRDLTIRKFGYPDRPGGAIYVDSSKYIVISNVTFTMNQADSGGVLYM